MKFMGLATIAAFGVASEAAAHDGCWQIERVSLSETGQQTQVEDALQSPIAVSDGGNTVVFASTAFDLVAEDFNFRRDIFVRNSSTSTTLELSNDAGGEQLRTQAYGGDIDGAGQRLVFQTNATQTNSPDQRLSLRIDYAQVFLADSQNSTGALQMISRGIGGVAGNGHSFGASISPDGRHIVFASAATNLLAEAEATDLDGNRLYSYDLETGVLELLIRRLDGSPPDDSGFTGVSFSDDGQLIAFASNDRELADGVDNDAWDIFVHDRQSGVTSVATRSADGRTLGGSSAIPPSVPDLSGDGQLLTFASTAGDVVEGAIEGMSQVYLYDRSEQRILLISHDILGRPASLPSISPVISANGRRIAFVSYAADLPDGKHDQSSGPVPNDANTFVYDIAEGTLQIASISASGGLRATGDCPGPDQSIAIGAEGSYVAFGCDADAKSLVEDDSNASGDVFLWTDIPVHSLWESGQAYEIGDRVSFGDDCVVWEARQAHTSQADWTPPAVSALWARPTPPDGSPWQTNTYYSAGSRVTYAGNEYIALIDFFSTETWPPDIVPSIWQPV